MSPRLPCSSQMYFTSNRNTLSNFPRSFSSSVPQRRYPLVSNPYSADQHPDLYLAVTPPPSVASGESTAYMPTRMAPIPRPQPDLKPSDIHHMAIDPNVASLDL